MLAWRILVHDRKRFTWSVLGVSFAVLLMFVEMGFYHGSYDAVTLPLRALDAERERFLTEEWPQLKERLTALQLDLSTLLSSEEAEAHR